MEATAFLKHMVRNLVGTLVQVGLGRRDAASIPALLLSGDRTQAGATAPPQGLVMAQVFYDPREHGLMGRAPAVLRCTMVKTPIHVHCLLLLSLACSGESGDPAEQLQLHRFCERWNDARCSMAAACGGTFSAACAATCDDPEWQRTFERLEQGRVRYDATAGRECLAAMEPDSCGEPWVCRSVVVGIVEPGGECGDLRRLRRGSDLPGRRQLPGDVRSVPRTRG